MTSKRTLRDRKAVRKGLKGSFAKAERRQKRTLEMAGFLGKV